jgi:hypothetical protein
MKRKADEKKSWQFVKILIIVIEVIAFGIVGLSVIALAAFFKPIIIAAMMVVIPIEDEKRNEGVMKAVHLHYPSLNIDRTVCLSLRLA